MLAKVSSRGVDAPDWLGPPWRPCVGGLPDRIISSDFPESVYAPTDLAAKLGPEFDAKSGPLLLGE
ncbi:MAG: hypothetical protein M3464_04060 [Chloroflexota bacterium]|nr:hypothetical protein [Chloroflexota bacterium]